MEASYKILMVKELFPIYGFDFLELLFLSATVLCWGVLIFIFMRILYSGYKGVMGYERKRRGDIQTK